ncbi:MAG TPA: hypothetical protein VMT53_22990 [Terriglobales bacterium]|nr:hypothetical protein [Terriglobales bacterium]
MNRRFAGPAKTAIGMTMAIILGWLVFTAVWLPAQVSVSAGPPRLDQVNVIYFASSADNVTSLLRSRLETWNAIKITSQIEGADAVLNCRSETRIVPSKVVVRITQAEVSLVDRHSQRLIWSMRSSAVWDSQLVDEIVNRLKEDRARSARNY